MHHHLLIELLICEVIALKYMKYLLFFLDLPWILSINIFWDCIEARPFYNIFPILFIFPLLDNDEKEFKSNPI